jgi:hypothetical protein
LSRQIDTAPHNAESGDGSAASIEAEAEASSCSCGRSSFASRSRRRWGQRQAAVQPLLDELEALFAAGPALDLDAAWAALDELEDQLEALSR